MDFAAGMFLVALPYALMARGGDSMSLGVAAGLRGGGYGLACILLARLADRFNRKLVMAVSVSCVSAGLIIAAGARSLAGLYVGSLFWALALAPFWPSVFSWLGDSHPTENLGRASNALNFSWSSGGMLGGIVSGALFARFDQRLFLLAVLPVIFSWLSLGLYTCPHRRPERGAPVKRRAGDRRLLAAALLANVSASALAGLITGVFPELGISVGIGPAAFGLLVAGNGLGRTFTFLAGLRWSGFLRNWRTVFALQGTAALLVAGIALLQRPWWLAAAFLLTGVSGGISYYRGIYTVLEAPGARGFKAGLFEAMLLFGFMLGAFPGGWLAAGLGLRTPYPVIAGFTFLLMAAQGLLLRSLASRERRETG